MLFLLGAAVPADTAAAVATMADVAKSSPRRVVQKSRKASRVGQGTLRQALVADLKGQSGRQDLQFEDAPESAATTMQSVPIEERAGYPLEFPPGSVDPKDWITENKVRITVDFARKPWLPNSWGQGVKTTLPTAHSTGGRGGTYTVLISPEGKVFYHRAESEKYWGRPFTNADGFDGTVRTARLQAQQAVQLARAQIIDAGSAGPQGLIGTDSDESFFDLLSDRERCCLPDKDELHFCVVSARRAAKAEGIRDIWMVQSQFLEAGVTPTWYVDEASLAEYRALGLTAVVGGKLTAARNKCLDDARSFGRACVECSDDISAWEYRDGPKAAVRTDDAMNAAHNAARRYIISPVAAARFILAKMRGAEDNRGMRPQLGGVYMLGSCARTFAGDAFVRQHFIIGDFFVVDKSDVRFDEEMKLKEDYDFACSHIKAHGSVMRCNRMTLNVKHYANSGGACTNRDSKGEEEQRNIAILRRKWPGVFAANPKRKNEVIMRWKASAGDQQDDFETGNKPKAKKTSPRTPKTASRKLPAISTPPPISPLELGAVVASPSQVEESPKKVRRTLRIKRGPATDSKPPFTLSREAALGVQVFGV